MRRLDATLRPVPGVFALCLLHGACAPPEGALEDRVLTRTWEPRSGEVIDCEGGSIRADIASEDNDGISVPDTLIFLKDVVGVRIQNCTLEGTFAIVAVGGGLHRITGNTIRASGAGVRVLSSDGNLIDDNDISSVAVNIMLNGDADGNVVSGNDITDHAGLAADGMPGFVEPGEPGALGVGAYTYPGVTNLVVNGELTQVVTWGSDHLDRLTVLDNEIHMDDEGAWGGIIFATRTERGQALGNRVSGVYEGISVYGWDDAATFLDPGACSLDPSRACGGDEDDNSCSLPGFSAAGTCERTAVVQGGGRVYSPSFVNNEVSDTVIGGWSTWPSDVEYIGNDLHGGETGLILEGYSPASGRVSGNVVEGFSTGLLLSEFAYAPVGESALVVAYNDFGGNDVPFDANHLTFGPPPDYPVDETLPYPLDTTLQSNWWGGDGCGFPEDDFWPLLDDPTAAAEPIAQAWLQGRAGDVARCD